MTVMISLESSDPQSAFRDYSLLSEISKPIIFNNCHGLASKYPPAQPGALGCEPLKAAMWGR